MRKVLIPVLALLFATSMVAVHASHSYADARDFHITNASQSLSVTALYVDVSGPGDFDPSSDLLKGDTLGPGEGGTVTFDPSVDAGQCSYDLQAQYSDGSTREFDNLNLCTTTEVTLS